MYRSVKTIIACASILISTMLTAQQYRATSPRPPKEPVAPSPPPNGGEAITVVGYKKDIKDLNSKEASNLIADLMAIKAGEAQLRIDGDGKATVIR